MSELEKAKLAEPGTRLRAGIHRTVSTSLLQTAAWQTLADGTSLWRVALSSAGSRGVRLEFRNFSVGTGQVWLHDGSNFVGPYTGRGPFNDGHFWSALVAAESVIVEYQPAADTTTLADPPFEISTVAHQARAGTQGIDSSSSDGADYCQLDPNCYTDWKPAMSMVGQLLFEDSGSEYLCSGSLVATRDNSLKPYLLTAGHCINTEAAARTVEVFWRYQTSACGAAPPTSRTSGEKSVLGADLMAYGTIAEGDYSLLLLKDVPSDVTFAGWDPTDPIVGSSLTGIHHPAGSWKRISFGARTADASEDVEGITAPADMYLQIEWTQGRIQPGSSGSPLFSSPGVIVGTLTYGPESDTLTACEINPSVGGYGRFSNTYTALQSYFENWPAATVTPSPASLSFTVSNHVASATQTVSLTSQSTGSVAFKIRADAPWLAASLSGGQISASAPVSLAVSINPATLTQPGTYTGTVTILAGTADPQFINVSVTVQITQSNVVASVSPTTVTASSGVWSFTVQLAETAGAATQVTAMKLNGTDYSSYIATWFGSAQIAANGTIRASLSATGIPKGPGYFEFWGTDVVSGQQWYRVTSATFQ